MYGGVWYVQGYIIRLSESLTASFRMELKNNVLSQASYKDSVSAATVDRIIRFILDEFHDRGAVFLFLSDGNNMFETNFTVFRMDG